MRGQTAMFHLVRSDKPKSQIYIESLPLFARSAISIPDHAKLLRELRLLERRTHRSGKDTVDHGRSGSDDHANALAGCAVNVIQPKSTWDSSLRWVRGDDDVPRGRTQRRNGWGFLPLAVRF
jgi:hypothetical protein